MAEFSPSGHAGLYSFGFAGDTFNTAWYVAQYAPEIEVSYLTAVGDDALSEAMLIFMRQSGIKTAHVARRTGSTVGLYMIYLEKGERRFSFWRSQSTARLLAIDLAALGRAMGEADLIYFSGITLAILEPEDRGNLLDAVTSQRQKGKTVVFDTNLRPNLWPSLDAMKNSISQAAACSDIVLPSFEDEAVVFGDTEPRMTVARYRALGAKSVIVKNGMEPVNFHDGQERGHVSVEPVPEIIDSTSAGDSFNAAFLAGYMTGRSCSSSVAKGCKVARAVVQHYGALVPVQSVLS